MIRITIISLSAIFFILSVIVTLTASRISGTNPHPPDSSTALQSDRLQLKEEDISAILKQLAKEQEINRALQKELQTAGAIPEARQPRVLLVLGGGDFSPGQSQLNPPAEKAVEALIPDILRLPGHRVTIEGHTDKTPVRMSPGKKYADNTELSFLRAKAVASILARKGISLERISAVGYGDSKPLASNDSAEGRTKNRRVEVKLIPEGK